MSSEKSTTIFGVTGRLPLRQLLNWLLLTIPIFCRAQADSTQVYKDHLRDAIPYFEAANFKKATSEYRQAFDAFHGLAFNEDRYHLAICYVQLHEFDSAFMHLMRLAEKTAFLKCVQLNRDTGFVKIKADPRWNALETKICGSNRELNVFLASMAEEDQYYRNMLSSYRNTEDSIYTKPIWKSIHYTDSVNLIKADSLYKIYGWPGYDLAGKEGSSAFWLIIQHSPLETQEKYLTVMVAKNQASVINLAYLEDRLNMYKKQPQKYGTQYQTLFSTNKSYLYPLQDAAKVNEFRAAIGLGPLSEKEIESSKEFPR